MCIRDRGEEGDVPIPSAALDIAEQDMEMEIVGQTSNSETLDDDIPGDPSY